jgi:hypothetical protein
MRAKRSEELKWSPKATHEKLAKLGEHFKSETASGKARENRRGFRAKVVPVLPLEHLLKPEYPRHPS